MRPKNVADWAEVISAFAVVISLFYLAFSVQQNTDAVRASGGRSKFRVTFNLNIQHAV
jgi:hypothetical protein